MQHRTDAQPVLSQVPFAGSDVLEIGCGAGRFTLANLTRARSVLGLDPNAEAIATLQAQWAAQHMPARADFRPGSIVEFPLPAEQFDVVVFSRSF
jgi:2-polyprenyl-3-methyl-5-hydroxy-6-metoxy-1,4-benzoquinol methylase